MTSSQRSPTRFACAAALIGAVAVSVAARVSGQLSASTPGSTVAELRRQFEQPPDDSRIMMRWWWFGPSVTKPQLARELRLMKEGGIGGVEVQPVYPVALDDEAAGIRNLPFLSEGFNDALRFAADTARDLGLRMDLTLGSGWPYGGPQVPIAQAAGRLRHELIPVPAGARHVALPDMAEGERLVTVFSARARGEALVPGSISEIPDAASRVREGLFAVPPPAPASTPSPASLPTPSSAAASSSAAGTAARASAAGAPAGGSDTPVLLVFIASRTGMMVKRAAVGSEGYVLDHYDRAALDNYLSQVGDGLLRAFGPRPPFAIFCDSLEVFASDWTGDLLQAFQQKRGYDLRPHLPALVADVGPQTAAIRHDWGLTLTELLEERFLAPMQAWSKQHGARFRVQGYGIPPATLSSNAHADLPEGEGWNWRTLTSSRWAASAAHLYQRPVVSSETWTWLHSPSFRATPLDMKAEADMHFLQGITQLIGHGWPYTAEGAAYPGWRFYAAAVFNEKNPWWIVMPDVARYLQRVSFVLRQGRPANDVAIYLPNADAWASFSAGRVHMLEVLRERLGPDLIGRVLDAGYNFDFVDDRSLRDVGQVEDGGLMLGGNRYRVVILPGVEHIAIDTLRTLDAFARRGGTVIATGRTPSLAPGFRATDADHQQVRELAARLTATEERQLGAALRAALPPDVGLAPAAPAVGVVHRRTADADLYFLANTSNVPVRADATFRVTRASAEWWDPMSGRATAAAIRAARDGRTTTLALEPYESRLLVFSDRRPGAGGTASGARTAPATSGASVTSSSSRASSSSASATSSVVDVGGWTLTFGPTGGDAASAAGTGGQGEAGARPAPSSPSGASARSSASAPVTFDRLRSWTENPDTRYFSGTAAYETTMMVPAAMVRPGVALRLDFGESAPVTPATGRNVRQRAWLDAPVRVAAVVYVNGTRAGSLWAPPYVLDVTAMVKAGENRVRVVVGNLAINHMAGRPLPSYRLLNLRYGVRFEPQDMDNLQPLPSGLLAPVRLRTDR